ncbi:MAG: TraR/DksA C4-type zinc finger protein [Pseudomonadota bacterium]
MDAATAKTILEKRRAELDTELHQIDDALDAPQPKDWEDRAAERQGDEVLEAKGHSDLNELRRIDAALARIADGSYGICAKCGNDISDARLQLLPDTPLCKNCAV